MKMARLFFLSGGFLPRWRCVFDADGLGAFGFVIWWN
jgi:hypothetical protein